MIGVKFFFLLVVIVGTLGILDNYKDTLSSSDAAGVWFACIVGAFWAYQTVRNVTRIAVAGSVRRWWRAPNQAAPSLRAYFRASTSNLGAAAFGSLFVAIVEAVNVLATSFAWSVSAEGANWFIICLAWCAACCVSCISATLKFFNRFAFSMVGIYQVGFLRSGARAFALLAHHGIDALINDVLIENVLVAGSFITGILMALFGWWWAKEDGMVAFYSNSTTASSSSTPTGSPTTSSASNSTNAAVEEAAVEMAIVSFFVAYITSHIIFGVVSSAVTTVFVCFVELPEALKRNRRDEYATLEDAWRGRFPHLFSEENDRLVQGG